MSKRPLQLTISVVAMLPLATAMFATARPPITTASPPAALVTVATGDPLVARLLRRGDIASFTELDRAASGLQVWRRCLAAGRVPELEGDAADFAPQLDGDAADFAPQPWPSQPLFGQLTSQISTLGLPKFSARHPSLVPALLAALLDASQTWEARQRAQPSDGVAGGGGAGGTAASLDGSDSDGLDSGDGFGDDDDNEAREKATKEEQRAAAEEEEREASERLARQLATRWQEPLRAVDALEGLYGLGANDDVGAATAPGGGAFSLQDGLWRHQGWAALEAVQRQLAELVPLRELMATLGDRVAEGGALRRGPAVRPSARAAPAAALSPLAPRELNGLERTGALSRLVPSEMALLAASRPADGDGDGDGAARRGAAARSPGLRREFFARLAQNNLLGYSLEGWSDASGHPARRRARLPRDRGGPLIICLDTSHSMAGGRERLAKAVVLEACRSAHAQGRPCLVYAFSGTHDLAELRLSPSLRRPSAGAPRRRGRRASGGGGCPPIDRRTLERLLAFLAHGFGGGTDVAGPLRRALALLDAPRTAGELQFSGADVLLVSDGELPSPPVDEETFARLHVMRESKGLQVHGLLVGEPRSTPLDELCDEVHGFLAEWDPLLVMQRATAAREEQQAEGGGAPAVAAPAPVAAARSLRRSGGLRMTLADAQVEQETSAEDVAAQWLSEAASSLHGSPEEEDGPADQFAPTLRVAAAALARGLVEREAEARLLLLALAGREHLLLLGPPGTAKSELCRRLSSVGAFSYFERTLTRFSTPEELFGPLSLAALERDEYRRATEGFAPRAELVFIDEVFKANSAILNTLLTLLNERTYDDGPRKVPAPLRTAVAASNELPETDDLDALYDRFLIRRVVEPVSDDGVLALLLGVDGEGGEGGVSAAGTAEAAAEVEEVARRINGVLDGLQARAAAVELPRFAALLLRDARVFVRDGSPEAANGAVNVAGAGYVSDRRLRRTAELLKSSAAAHGRAAVSLADLAAVLPHVLWDDPASAPALAEWVEEHLLPERAAEQLEFLLGSLRRRAEEHAEQPPEAGAAAAMREGDAIAADAAALAAASVDALREMRGHAHALRTAPQHLFLADAVRLRQRLLPIAEASCARLERVATAAAALRRALESGASAEVLRVLASADGCTGAGGGDEADAGVNVGANGAAAGGGGGDFTDEQLTWGRKEAKAKLDPEVFKRWRKEVKKLSKGKGKGSSGGSADDDDRS